MPEGGSSYSISHFKPGVPVSSVKINSCIIKTRHCTPLSVIRPIGAARFSASVT